MEIINIEFVEFIIGILVFAGSLISIWVSLTKKVEKVEVIVNGLVDYKNESAVLVRARFAKMDEDIEKRSELLEKHFDAKFAELRTEREALAIALEKQNEKIWNKLDAIETKIDNKFESFNKLKIEHEQQMACKFKEIK